MKGPGFGEANIGAMIGAITGGIGGLFAIGIAGAVIERSIAVLFEYPTLSLLSWVFSGPTGWILGGQIGPRLGMRFRKRKAEITGGIVGGLIPVIIVALVGWYLKVH